jgi:hypothetical protein
VTPLALDVALALLLYVIVPLTIELVGAVAGTLTVVVTSAAMITVVPVAVALVGVELAELIVVVTGTEPDAGAV